MKIDTSDFEKGLRKYQKHIDSSADKGLDKASLYLLKKSIEVTPVGDTRNLRNSGSAEKIGHLKYSVGFGGLASQYALRLHEHPEYNFRTDKNPKAQGKYLEQPYKQNKTRLYEIVADAMKV